MDTTLFHTCACDRANFPTQQRLCIPSEAWERGLHLTSNNHRVRRAVHLLQWYNDNQFMDILGSDNCETFRVYFTSIASACRELCTEDVYFANMIYRPQRAQCYYNLHVEMCITMDSKKHATVIHDSVWNHRYNTEQDRKLLFITLIHARTPCCRAY